MLSQALKLTIGKSTSPLRTISATSLRNMASFYGFSADDINGEKVEMAKYKGKVVLIENTASL